MVNGFSRYGLALFFFACASFAVAGAAFGAHPLITDDTGTQGKGKYQVELNSQIHWDKATSNGIEIRENGGELAALLSAGVADTVDVVVGLPWVWSRIRENGAAVVDGNGPGDMSLEVKWRFFARDGYSLAVKPGVTFPTGDEEKGFGAGRATYGLILIATREWERFFLHVNGGYHRKDFQLYADREANRRDIWHASVAAGAEAMKGLKVVANVGMETNSDKGSNTWPSFILGGVIYSVTENLDVDLGVKLGLNRPESDLAGLAGLAWRF